MNYQFPTINHINDVLPAIKDSPEFIVAQKDGYQVVNYVVATHETFPQVMTGGDPRHQTLDDVYDHLAAIRRECRGLVFDMEGNLINRRYHKFFNVGEKDETQLDKIDWSRPHVILEKLDGSMVSPCMVNGHLRWITKMGITDTSMEAETFVAKNPKYVTFANEMISIGLNPIFEWCSNKNRIVLDYPEDSLVLTAVREIVSGQYRSYKFLEEHGNLHRIPVVVAWRGAADKASSNTLMDIVRESENTEGIVVRFDDGHMVKIKSSWYVRIHKVKSLLGQERDVVALILNNELDDMLPILPKEDVEKIEKFSAELFRVLRIFAENLRLIVTEIPKQMDRKTFALEKAPSMNQIWRGLIFQFWDKECDEHLTYAAIVAMILKHCGSNASYAKIKEAFLKDVDYV
jgi:RNA ligase